MSAEENVPVVIPRGAIFTITSGECSDYYVRGVFKALKDIDALALRDAYLIKHPEQTEDYKFRDDQFIAELARERFMKEIECWELHTCDYHRASEMELTEIKGDIL